MIGLIRKDFCLFALSSKIFIIFIAIAIITVFFGDRSTADFIVTFASSYMAVMCGLQVISTITYDELDNGGAYLMTLPVTRSTYVYSKYLFTLIMALLGGLGAFAVTMLGCKAAGMQTDIITVLFSCLGSIGVICVILSFMIPLQLKYGGEKGRIVLFVLVAAVLLFSFGTKKICQSMGIDIDEVIKAGNEFINSVGLGILIGIGVSAAIIIIAASLAVSLKIIKNKEYV